MPPEVPARSRSAVCRCSMVLPPLGTWRDIFGRCSYLVFSDIGNHCQQCAIPLSYIFWRCYNQQRLCCFLALRLSRRGLALYLISSWVIPPFCLFLRSVLGERSAGPHGILGALFVDAVPGALLVDDWAIISRGCRRHAQETVEIDMRPSDGPWLCCRQADGQGGTGA